MIKKATKKPVTIEFVIWNGDNLAEVIGFTGINERFSEWFNSFAEYEQYVRNDGNIFKIFTLEGTMRASAGDYIIRGVNGEFYPCKPDIFRKTYDVI